MKQCIDPMDSCHLRSDPDPYDKIRLEAEIKETAMIPLSGNAVQRCSNASSGRRTERGRSLAR